MKNNKTITVEVTFSITIPETSEDKALALMEEAVCLMENSLDNSDSIFDTFYEVFPTEDKNGKEIEYEGGLGYDFGFGDARIVEGVGK